MKRTDLGMRKSPAVESQDITFEIITEFTGQFLATHMGLTQSAVFQWKEGKTRDIFIRVYDLLREMQDTNDTGRKLALRLDRLFCRAIGCVPVTAPEDKLSFLSILSAVAKNQHESGEAMVSISDMLTDQLITTEEINHALSETRDQLEAVAGTLKLLEYVARECEENGGQVVMTAKDLERQVVV